MPGKWKIWTDTKGRTVTQYRDFQTGKEFFCGRTPPTFPTLFSLDWLFNSPSIKLHCGDLIEYQGVPFVIALDPKQGFTHEN